MSNLILFPGCVAANYCLPAEKDGAVLRPYYIADDYLNSFGIRAGMVLLTRELLDGEMLDGQVCALHLQGNLVIKRVWHTTEGVRLADDTAEKLLDEEQDGIHIERVAAYACSCDLLAHQCEPVALSALREAARHSPHTFHKTLKREGRSHDGRLFGDVLS